METLTNDPWLTKTENEAAKEVENNDLHFDDNFEPSINKDNGAEIKTGDHLPDSHIYLECLGNFFRVQCKNLII